MFNYYLTLYRKNQDLTQQDLVNLLAKEYKKFSKFDAVTLSRWENQKTQPPLKKQFQVLDYMGYLKEFISQSQRQELDHNSSIAKYVAKKFQHSTWIMTEITNSSYNEYQIINDDKKIDIDLFIDNYFYDKNIEEKIFRKNIKTISWVKNGSDPN